MAINRYTNITPSQFNPLSLEEVMLVPSMKRKQHDQTIAAQEGIRQKLAEVDPLDVHNEEAIRLRESMNNKLDAQAQQLASQGVSNGTQGDFLALNREYQNLTGPTGRLGQINNAKKVYFENMKTFIEDAQKEGYSRKDALRNWQTEMHDKYSGYDDENKTNIVNIGQYGAPKRLVLQDDLKFVNGILGEQTRTLMRNNGFSWSEGPNGSIIVKDGKGKVVQTDNIPQLKEAQEYLNSRWNTENGEGAISAKFEDISPNRIINEINSGLGMMKKLKIDDTREDDYSVQGYKNQADWDEQNAVGELIETTSSFLPNEFAVNDYNTNQTKLDNLLNIKKSGKELTKEQNIELSKLQSFQNTLQKTLSTDSTYNQYKKFDDQAQNIAKKAGITNPYVTFNTGLMENMAAGQRWTFEKTTDGKYQQVKHQQSTQGNWSKTKVGKPITSAEKNILEKGNSFNKKMEQRRNELTKENSVKTTGYNMLPTTPKEAGLYKVFNESFASVLKNPEALRKYMNIESVDLNGESLKPSTDDKDGLANLYSNYGQNLQVTNMIPQDFNGKPGYIIEFNTGDESYNMDDWSKGSVGGKDKTVRMKVTFNKEYGNELGTINHYGLKYFESKGQINPNTGKPIGYDLANEARKNMYNHTTYKDVFNDESYNWQNDQIVKNNMYKTIKKDIAKNGVKSVYSGINDMSLLTKIFLDHDGNNFINE